MSSLHEVNDVGNNGDDSSPPTRRNLRPTISEVKACQFSSWYSTFRNMDTSTIQNNITNKRTRKNVTIESIIIRPLSSNFIEYLLSDGVCLPECATKVSSCMNDADDISGNDDRWDSSSNEEDEEVKKYSFPTLTDQIHSAITTLGGSSGCMPKLNWSSPKDASWMNCGSLKCTKVGDVYLLLKSSDFIGFDLEKAWDDCLVEEEEEEDDVNYDGTTSTSTVDNGVGNLTINEPSSFAVRSRSTTIDDSSTSNNNTKQPHGFEYELVLRKWCNLHPSMEYRCFVYEHELVAISQRQTSKFYPHLQPPSDGSAHPSTTIIHAFFQTYIRKRFAQGDIHKYVMDLYLDSQERVWIVDFNVWGDRTDGLLFDWKDLMEIVSQNCNNNEQAEDDDAETKLPEMRVVTKDMKSMTYDPLSSYRGPTDVMDLVGSDGNYKPSFEEFMRQCVRPYVNARSQKISEKRYSK